MRMRTSGLSLTASAGGRDIHMHSAWHWMQQRAGPLMWHALSLPILNSIYSQPMIPKGMIPLQVASSSPATPIAAISQATLSTHPFSVPFSSATCRI